MGRYSKAAEKARQLTNKQLAEEITSLSLVTQRDLNRLIPRKADRLAFVNLMKEVESETSEDEKLAYLMANAQTAGRVAIKVLKFFV